MIPKALPLVSIIAICHNHFDYVIESLDSFRNQTYHNIQLIIINNVKDACEDIIKNWIDENTFKEDPIFIQNENPKTVVQNCNLGLSYCTGKYFQPISCDDVMLPIKIEKQVKVFESLDDNYACVYGDVVSINEKSEVSGSYLRSLFLKNKFNVDLNNNLDYKKMIGWSVITQAPSILLKTRIVKKLGGYDEQYVWEDYQLSLKLIFNDYKFKYLNEILIHYRVLSDSISRKELNNKSKYEIGWMFIDLYIKYSSIFHSDYWTRVRFTRKFNSLLFYNKKMYLELSIKFISLQKFPSNILSALNIYLVYPIARYLKSEKFVFKVQDRLYKIFQ